VNAWRVGRHQHVEFAKSVGGAAAVEVRDELTIVGIEAINETNVALPIRAVTNFQR